MKFRVNVAVCPTGEIEDVGELLPPKEVIDDYENMDKLTDQISVQSHRLSDQFFNYLRQTMTSHYEETGGVDSAYLMISCPRVIDFELLIVDWAIQLLQKIGKDELLKESTLKQDEAELAKLLAQLGADHKLITILRLNIVTKHIYHGQIKTLKVLQAILRRLQDLEVDDDDGYAKATHSPIEQIETGDSAEELFKRRMGMRNYLCKLKMSLVRVKNAKEAKQAAKESGKEELSTTVSASLDGEMSTKEASAIVEAEAKGGAASVTNPPVKGKKGGAAAAKKKKGTAAKKKKK